MTYSIAVTVNIHLPSIIMSTQVRQDSFVVHLNRIFESTLIYSHIMLQMLYDTTVNVKTWRSYQKWALQTVLSLELSTSFQSTRISLLSMFDKYHINVTENLTPLKSSSPFSLPLAYVQIHGRSRSQEEEHKTWTLLRCTWCLLCHKSRFSLVHAASVCEV